MKVTAAGVDTWSPSWYVDPEGQCGAWLREFATAPAAQGAQQLPGPVGSYRVGWFPKAGLVYAEGHPDAEGLCPAGELLARAIELQDVLQASGMPLPGRERRFAGLGSDAEGWSGLRRADFTVNFEASSRAEGLAVLAGVAACVRDSPGHAQVRFGLDRAVETVYLHGYAGKRVLGRWYDKGLEAATGDRGKFIRGEDQRRWGKLDRRHPEELTAEVLKSSFQRRFYPLWKATRGVTVAGPVVLAEKILECVEEGRIGAREAQSLCGHLVLQVVGGRRAGGVSPATMYRREQRARELGLAVADGVLEEVEVDVGAVLEQALETDAWERRG